LPRASAASTAVEQRGPAHRAPCGVISRQARHTGPSGGGIQYTSGSSNPSVRPPRGVRTAALGRTTSLNGGWRLWSGAETGGCWDRMGASPAYLTRAPPFPCGPSRGAGRPCVPPASPLVSVTGRLPSVPPGGAVGRDPRREVPPALGRPNWIAPPTGGRASGVSRRGGHRRGARLGCGPGCGGAHGWPRWMESLHVPPELRPPAPCG